MPVRNALSLVLAGLLMLQSALCLAQDDAAIVRYPARHHPVPDGGGMVASQNAVASAVGAEVLAAGGNAVDAAVAVGFALAVTLPRAGNIGGGGFMLVYIADSDETVAIDYREMAPPGATRDMFLDADGNVDPVRSRYSHLASGVPGTVAGLHAAHERHGSLPWRDLLQPAIELAHRGIVVSHDLASLLDSRRERLMANDASAQYFYRKDGSSYAPGDRLVQRDLASSLRLISRHGADAFYTGAIARKIVAEMAANGGLIDAEALAAYEPVFRVPLEGEYRGYRIVSMPPSSSGGVHIIQMLNVLQHFPVATYGPGSADNVHLLAEVSKLAYADRSEHLGDMAYHNVPIDWLTSKDYARQLADGIDLEHARPSTDIKPGAVPPAEGPDTTHFSIMDGFGNAVANTYTLNFSYGSGISVPGAGFLLNNEMDDFVAKPGVPDAFGLLGGKANAVEPGKRPLSSMTPTMVFRDNKPWLVTGSPGGSQIITSVLQMLVNIMDHGMNIADATAVPRMHHQWMPDVLKLESGFSPDTAAELVRRGHAIETSDGMGSLQSVMYHDGLYYGASDPRRPQAGSIGPRMHSAGN
ncbi:MAG: gamma-glutamyltransferase [Woeseia sp.]